MMKNKLSSRDWARLSAYLDGELSSGERARLERRLRGDVDLRRALDDLRQTRAALRSLPVVRARRNFTLTPEMVAPWRPSRAAVLYPVVRLVALATSLLFVVLLFRDVTGVGQPMLAAAPAMEMASVTEKAVSPLGEEAAPDAAFEAAEAPQEKTLPSREEPLPAATQAPSLVPDVAPTAEVIVPVASPRAALPLTLISGLVALATIGAALFLRSRL